jgi:hypothetical protein
MEPYIILGACNPQLAHRALDLDCQTGLLLALQRRRLRFWRRQNPWYRPSTRW